METEVAEHLNEAYGDRAPQVAALCRPTGKRWPQHGTRLSPLYPILEEEVVYACRHEYACKATDVLGRRTRLAFLSCHAALDALPRVLELMAAELGWDGAERERQRQEAMHFLQAMGLGQCHPARALFTPAEITRMHESVVRVGMTQALALLKQWDAQVEEVRWVQLLTELEQELPCASSYSAADLLEIVARAKL